VSRIGKQPVPVPSGVEVEIDNNKVTVKGPKGELSQQFTEAMIIKVDENVITVARPDDARENRALHGLTRTLVANMVTGVSEGFVKNLEIVGVGYRAAMNGEDIEMQLGFSHPVIVKAEKNISFEVPVPTRITVRGIDKQRVGQIAAEIRGWRSPEPYKGKGIRYEGERVRRKLGKTAK